MVILSTHYKNKYSHALFPIFVFTHGWVVIYVTVSKNDTYDKNKSQQGRRQTTVSTLSSSTSLMQSVRALGSVMSNIWIFFNATVVWVDLCTALYTVLNCPLPIFLPTAVPRSQALYKQNNLSSANTDEVYNVFDTIAYAQSRPALRTLDSAAQVWSASLKQNSKNDNETNTWSNASHGRRNSVSLAVIPTIPLEDALAAESPILISMASIA